MPNIIRKFLVSCRFAVVGEKKNESGKKSLKNVQWARFLLVYARWKAFKIGKITFYFPLVPLSNLKSNFLSGWSNFAPWSIRSFIFLYFSSFFTTPDGFFFRMEESLLNVLTLIFDWYPFLYLPLPSPIWFWLVFLSSIAVCLIFHSFSLY